MPKAIIVFGPNGAGKTTLGRALARALGFKHMDSEDYYFHEAEIPYTKPRSREECAALMLADIQSYGSFVLTACTGDFGDEITQYYSLAVYLSAPKDLRMERIERRGYDRFGARVREGGDMHQQQLKFQQWAATRDLTKIDQWAKTLTCPVIHMDGTREIAENVKWIAHYYEIT